jgi:hypothetical protein
MGRGEGGKMPRKRDEKRVLNKFSSNCVNKLSRSREAEDKRLSCNRKVMSELARLVR